MSIGQRQPENEMRKCEVVLCRALSITEIVVGQIVKRVWNNGLAGTKFDQNNGFPVWGEKLAKETAESMPELSEKTIDKLNEKVNFSKAFATIDSLYAARSCLNDEVVDDLDRLLKKLDAITEGHVDEFRSTGALYF